MCYYNGIKIPVEKYIKLKEFESAIKDRGLVNQLLVNGFDYSQYPVLKKSGEKDFEVVGMEWGFLPSYIQTREKANQFRQGFKKENGTWQQPILTLNAKGEELLFPNKIFRDAALHRRCVVLSSGFYEWRHVNLMNAKTGMPAKTVTKFPYYITLKNREYFFMAGIWQPWQDRETGEYVETFAIVTTQANALMAQIHNSKKRMPVVLNEDMACEWLLGNPDEKRITQIATSQIDSEEMHAISIARDFRETPEPTQPVVFSDLPPLKF